MAGSRTSILFVDAYDSFTQNIVALLHQELKAEISLIKIDTNIKQEYGLTLRDFLSRFSAVVLGPGPGNPNCEADVGLFRSVFRCAEDLYIPILGICLGFQTLCLQYGLCVNRMPEPCHGHTKQIFPMNQGLSTSRNSTLFQQIDSNNLWATCYNSLGVRLNDFIDTPYRSRRGSSSANSTVSSTSSQDHCISSITASEFINPLTIIANDEERNAMAVVHDRLPFWGVQFHLESCKSSDSCKQLLRNWLTEVDKNNIAMRSDQTFAAPPSLGGVKNLKLQVRGSGLLWSKAKIYAELSHAASPSGNLVQWRKLHVSCTREEISELINSSCSEAEIAMLESTKKGRFSIYAITGEWTKISSRSEHIDAAAVSPLFVSYDEPRIKMMCNDHHANIAYKAEATSKDFMDALEDLMISKRADGGSPEVPFWGGFVGYISYENGLKTLDIPTKKAEGAAKDISLMWVDRSLIFDNQTSTIYIQSIRKNDNSFVNTVSGWFKENHSRMSTHGKGQTLNTEAWRKKMAITYSRASAQYSLPDQTTYNSQFDECQRELHNGNSYELCLTTEARVSMSVPREDGNRYVFELYKNLHHHNPVPFGAYLDFPEITILSTSPEQYMSWTRSGTIDMIPMKGTVKRSPSMTLSRATKTLSSRKEQAENLMIADLIRHDLYSTVGHTSKVEVIKLCEVVEHETVYQLVSHIRAHSPIPQSLSPDMRQKQAIHYGFNALRTTLPPGSMTGAPKKRSCEILQEIENRNRGLYSGVLGYLDVGGGGCWSVCIRTAFRTKTEYYNDNDDDDESSANKERVDVWRVGAGGAITVLSDQKGEWDEMTVKLQSVLKGFKE